MKNMQTADLSIFFPNFLFSWSQKSCVDKKDTGMIYYVKQRTFAGRPIAQRLQLTGACLCGTLLRKTIKGGSKINMEIIIEIFQLLLLCFLPNSYLLIDRTGALFLIPLFVVSFLAANVVTLLPCRRFPSSRLRVCDHGARCLKLFLASVTVSALYHTVLIASPIPVGWTTVLWSALVCILTESVLFWNGMLCVYLASVQLGVRHRAVGFLCGCVPILHLFVLVRIIRTVSEEVAFETACAKRDDGRREDEICHTRYPILLVHGVFFRDRRFPNYWGRIPASLIKNGAALYYGNHQSASSVKDSAEELAVRIREIAEQTGCEKLNVIAHSKGGLDVRYAIARCGAAPYIASLTTINTPHRGCEFADYLLEKIPRSVQEKVSTAYNGTMKKLGDASPDFMAAVRDLTAQACAERDRELSAPEGILCQSVGSRLDHAAGGKFPLNFSYLLVRHFDGPNDGLVAEASFRWGEAYTFLTVKGKRGISHGDMIDLNRENIPDFDVREFYVQLVRDLKVRGL